MSGQVLACAGARPRAYGVRKFGRAFHQIHLRAFIGLALRNFRSFVGTLGDDAFEVAVDEGADVRDSSCMDFVPSVA